MRTTLEVSGAGANANKFILHWWLSRSEYTAERKLFRLMKRSISRSQAQVTLYSLASDASLYARIANPGAWRCSRHQRPLQESLIALNIFGVRQPRPLLLSVLRAVEDGSLPLARAK